MDLHHRQGRVFAILAGRGRGARVVGSEGDMSRGGQRRGHVTSSAVLYSQHSAAHTHAHTCTHTHPFPTPPTVPLPRTRGPHLSIASVRVEKSRSGAALPSRSGAPSGGNSTSHSIGKIPSMWDSPCRSGIRSTSTWPALKVSWRDVKAGRAREKVALQRASTNTRTHKHSNTLCHSLTHIAHSHTRTLAHTHTRTHCHAQSINQSINQSTNQPTNQSINQSTNQPINVPSTV